MLDQSDLLSRFSYAAMLADFFLAQPVRNKLLRARNFPVGASSGIVAPPDPNRVALAVTYSDIADVGDAGFQTVDVVIEDGNGNALLSHGIFMRGAVATSTQSPMYSPLFLNILQVGSLICGAIRIHLSVNVTNTNISVNDVVMAVPVVTPNERGQTDALRNVVLPPSGGFSRRQ